jgi:heptosyltransferase-3
VLFLHYAIICAEGIGDALLMMIVAHHLRLHHFSVTVFHKSPNLITPLFPWARILPYPELAEFENTFKTFDHLIFQNDHSKKAFHLDQIRSSGILSSCRFFLITPSKLARAHDFVFDNKYSLVENIIHATKKLLICPMVTKDNGILSFETSSKHQFPKRIVIHPTSTDPQRNWKASQYLALATKLKNQGFDPCFVMTAKEKLSWTHPLALQFPIFIQDNLLDTAKLLHSSGFFIGNDSGIGHLASNLGIPTLTISGNPKRARRWKPSFSKGAIVTLAFNLPNFKGLVFRYFDGRFRDKYWHYFLPVGKVVKRFNQLVNTTYNQKDFS